MLGTGIRQLTPAALRYLGPKDRIVDRAFCYERVGVSTRELVFNNWIDRSYQSDRHALRLYLDYRDSDALYQVSRLCVDILRKLCELMENLPELFLLQPRSVTLDTQRPHAQGGYGDIYSGTFKVKTGVLKVKKRKVAVKRPRNAGHLSSAEYPKDLCREVVIWKLLAHKNITRCFGAYRDAHGPSLVLEWMPNGTVVDFLRMNPSANRLRLIEDVAEGLNYLHYAMGVMHGDVRGTNILINADCVACLSDFNIARILYDVKLQTNSHGRASLRYMPPEFMDTSSSDEKFAIVPSREGDTFSFGMTMLEIFTGEPPFPTHHDAQVIIDISRGKRPSRPSDRTEVGLSDGIWTLIERCWQTVPWSRPSMMQVKQCIQEARRASPAP
ncbi:kinase-like protein [Obba rivulosa]|uniref:Kinase-like protein n=1 Tax=Obba rivulosa TaxID=1052685 RepID=A0A8E2DLL1_9APHY|nr:kinase-like protein [Obba rivulosa]